MTSSVTEFLDSEFTGFRARLLDRLDWQCAVNRVLIAAGYSWGRSMVSPADLKAMGPAFVAGDTPESFAHSVIMKDEHEAAA